MSDPNLPVPATSQGVAVPGSIGTEGLGDMTTADLTMPIFRLTPEGFLNTLTNEVFTSFESIALGLIKQRILWPPEVGTGDSPGPMCRSYGPNEQGVMFGHPDVAQWAQRWNGVNALEASGWSYEQVDQGNLPCDNCGLAKWDSHPSDNKPWCNEQFTIPFYFIHPNGQEPPVLSVVSFQRSGIKPTRQYLSGFAQTGKALYTVHTTMMAVQAKRGSVEYSVPSFRKGKATDPGMWAEYSIDYAGARTFLTTPRRRDGEDAGPVQPVAQPVRVQQAGTIQPQQPIQATSTPAPAPAPVAPRPAAGRAQPAAAPQQPAAAAAEAQSESAPQPVQRAQPETVAPPTLQEGYEWAIINGVPTQVPIAAPEAAPAAEAVPAEAVAPTQPPAPAPEPSAPAASPGDDAWGDEEPF